ncbi:MAG: 16S rRNA (adenine(1518)-N(6)/adenine(1519)-N(6))-dimethyltransferase RsmA [Spirochaetaceae bacterium]|nr:16S rRNA (adenine(1518)-N(6)/adenine(1519)-N(6))-dimethyltransferase RsmA [Spirochaetaceae bacterium]
MPPLDYNSGPALRSFLESRGLSIRKQWGQNFLVNPQARRTLADALDAEKGASVWEIGSGLGAMTAELLERGMDVTAFEIDPGYCTILEELFAGPCFTLIRGDVLKTWKSAEPSPYLFGNLPYVTAALLLGNLIEGHRFFTRMAVTVQKEVALRMTARPGSKNYSSISVLCACAYSSKVIMTLKGPSFYPVPHVESAAVCFDRLPGTSLPPPLFYPVVRSLFASRRKTIANNLENFLSRSDIIKKKERGMAPSLSIREKERKAVAAAALEKCGLRGGDRAENLPAEAFLALAAELENNCIVRKGNDGCTTN